MFGQTKSSRRCVSQKISKQRREPYFIAILSLILSGLLPTASVFAQTQTRELNDQTDRDVSLPPQPIYDYQPKRPNTDFSFSDFLKNLHGSYSVSLMGPRLIGNSNETYNIYLPDVAPMQLYHSAQLGYQVSNDLQIGVSISAPQNIVDNVRGRIGTYGTSFELYDPNIYFNMPNLVQVPGWWVSTTGSFSLSLSQASQDIGRITSIIIQQSWSVKTWPSPWGYGFNLYFNPQFYTEPMPKGFYDRQTLSASWGPFASYRVSPEFVLAATTTLDVEHRSPDSQGFLHLGDNLEDRAKLSAAIQPNIFPMFLTIRGYFQFLLWKPASDTSIIGADFAIGF